MPVACQIGVVPADVVLSRAEQYKPIYTVLPVMTLPGVETLNLFQSDENPASMWPWLPAFRVHSTHAHQTIGLP